MPDPVGPVASTAPWLRFDRASPAARGRSARIPSWSSSRTSRPLSRIRSTADSPRITGSVATRMSMNRPSTVSPMRPSCGRAPLGDVEVGHDLDPRDQSGREPPRHGGRVDRDAVDPVADAQVAVAGVEVDVGGAAPDGVGDDRVDELDHRRVVGRLAKLELRGAARPRHRRPRRPRGRTRSAS